MKRFVGLILLLVTSSVIAQTVAPLAPIKKGETCPQVQQFDLTFPTSGQSLTIANDCGSTAFSINYEITGTPSAMSIVLQGCVRGTTASCDTLDTNTSTTSSKSVPTFTTVYDYFTVTPTWTGGGVSVKGHSTASPFAKKGSGGATYTGSGPIVVNNTTHTVDCPTCGVGTGNMSNSGTPASNQLGIFVDATHVKGATMSGDATMDGSAVTTIGVGKITDAKAAIAVKPSVTVVATSNLTLSGAQTIDGVAGTAAVTIVLATAQTTASQNGPWIMQSGAWTRPTWYTSGSTTQAVPFSRTFVQLGSTYQGSTWQLTTNSAITIDTTSTAWAVITMLPSNLAAGPLPSGVTVADQTAGDNSSKPANTKYVDAGLATKATDANVVHTTAVDETVGGNKTFSNSPIIPGLVGMGTGFGLIIPDQDAPPAGTPAAGTHYFYGRNQMPCYKNPSNTEICLDGQSSLNVNGNPVTRPNLSDAPVAADAGYQLGKWLTDNDHAIGVEWPIQFVDPQCQGYIVETANGTWVCRSIAAAANSGLAFTGNNGVSGNTTISAPGIFKVIYSTTSATQSCPSSPCSGTTLATLVATTPASTTDYRVSFYVEQVGLGVACTGNTTIQVQVTITGPNQASSGTIPVGTCAVLANGTAGKALNCGGGTLGQASGSYIFKSKASTSIVAVTTYTAGAACTTNPTYTVTPYLEQL